MASRYTNRSGGSHACYSEPPEAINNCANCNASCDEGGYPLKNSYCPYSAGEGACSSCGPERPDRPAICVRNTLLPCALQQTHPDFFYALSSALTAARRISQSSILTTVSLSILYLARAAQTHHYHQHLLPFLSQIPRNITFTHPPSSLNLGATTAMQTFVQPIIITIRSKTIKSRLSYSCQVKALSAASASVIKI